MINFITSAKNILQSFSFIVLPIFYTTILLLLCLTVILKSDFFSNFRWVQKSKFLTRIEKRLSITDFFLMIFIFIYFAFFTFTYNYATENLLISLGTFGISLLITTLLVIKNKPIKKFSSSQFLKVFYTIALFIFISNMFAYPEAFSIEKPGNIDLIKIVILGFISMLSGFILSTSTSYYFANRRNFKAKNKFKNRSFFNKILIVLILNSFVLLLFTEAEFASKSLLLFSFILGNSVCKKFTEENWQLVNNASTTLISALLCMSAIFTGNMFLTIISAIILGLSFKDFSQQSFDDLTYICKSSFLCKRNQ